MNQTVSHSDHIIPRNFGMGVFSFLGYLASDLAYDLQRSHDGVLQQVIALKFFPRHAFCESKHLPGGHKDI
ncbi:MAG: hypothetical protein ACREQ2_21165 [Candidatus Binatia bacterium]